MVDVVDEPREGHGRKEDLAHTEETGEMEGAAPAEVSARAKERGREQLGSLGAGNHFIEVDVVDQVFDAGAAGTLGLYAGNLAVQIHCGSRGFGHQICTDYVDEFQAAIKLNPEDLQSRIELAELFSKDTNYYPQALREDQEIISLQPFRVESYHQMGWIYENLGKLDEAFCCYKGLELFKAANRDENMFLEANNQHVVRNLIRRMGLDVRYRSGEANTRGVRPSDAMCWPRKKYPQAP
jgi:hypothetical protein